jgi:hypothetical protein
VRLIKGRIRARIKSDLPITFSREQISAHGGLELFRRYLETLDLAGALRRALQGLGLEGDYGAAQVGLALIGLLIIGGWRVTHLAFVGTDPILLRFCGLHRMPSDRTVVRWLKRFSPRALLALQDLIRDLVHTQVERCGLRRLTIDLDGTVLRTGAKVGGAVRGFNPHHPKDPSYYPLTAHLAQLGQILGIWNRPGNITDSHNADGFLRVVVRELRERFGRRLPIELRMDAAFFMPAVFAFLDEAGVDYAIKVPMWKWLGLLEVIAKRRRWTRVNHRVGGFAVRLPIGPWDRVERVVVYRKRVSHRSRKNFQLDLFSPDNGHYEYSAVATNKSLGVRALWHFAAGRGGHEKTISELKQHFGFDAIPTNDWNANSAWQLISVLALNLVRSFQIALGAPERPRIWKRTFDYVFQSLQTLRFELIHQPVRIVRPAGRTELRFAVAPSAQQRILQAQRRLAQAA